MLINARRQKIIDILSKTNAQMPLTVLKLAKIIGVSERSVRYDLDYVADEMLAKGFRLCRRAQKGIWAEPLDESELSSSTRPEYIMSQAERCQGAVVLMLGCREPVASDWLAEKLVVSRSTLLNDLKFLRKMLAQHKLHIWSKRGAGIGIAGEETAIRQMLLQIFTKYHYDFSNFPDAAAHKTYEYALLSWFAGDVDVRKVYERLTDFVNSRCLLRSDFSLNCMMLALLIQIKRYQSGFYLQPEAMPQFQLDDNSQLKSNARYLFERLVNSKLLAFDESELLFCMMQLLSSKLMLAEELSADKTVNNADFMEGFALARSFIECCQAWLNDILVDDDELLYNLALHLQPAIKRARYGIELINPLLPKIRQTYGDLFMISLRAAEKIEQRLNIKISDDEIGYLTIHLGAAIERRKSMFSRRLNVVLVCGNGIGTSNLLARTLSNRMEYLHIVKTTAVRDLDMSQLDHCDIIISTLPLNIKDKAVLQISPILSEEEIVVIQQQLQYFYNKKFALPDKTEQPPTADISIADLLSEVVVVCDAAAADWEEAIRLAGNLLTAADYVEPRYVEAMVSWVKEMGPYIVIGRGLAMPHAGCGDGVKQVGLSVIKLKAPVCFGSSANDPVDLVVAFSSIDEKAHLQVLEELWELFNDAEALAGLRSCRTKEAMLTILRSFAKEKE